MALCVRVQCGRSMRSDSRLYCSYSWLGLVEKVAFCAAALLADVGFRGWDEGVRTDAAGIDGADAWNAMRAHVGGKAGGGAKGAGLKGARRPLEVDRLAWGMVDKAKRVVIGAFVDDTRVGS